jgi:hypothetical protein
MDVKLINGGIIISVPVYETRSLKSQGRVTEGSGQLRVVANRNIFDLKQN